MLLPRRLPRLCAAIALAGALSGCGSEADDGLGGTKSGQACCPDRGSLAFGGQTCTREGQVCPWVYGDTGAVGGGVTTCEKGEWKATDCPYFYFPEGEECPPLGTDLGPCDADWEDTLCICACKGTAEWCGDAATCVGGRWVLGAFSTDERQCEREPPPPGCGAIVLETSEGSCFAERTCDDQFQAIDCFVQADGTAQCECRLEAQSSACIEADAELACSFDAGCCASALPAE